MNYKELIFSAIGDKFTDANINKVYFEYNVNNSKPKLYAVDNDEKPINLELTGLEHQTIKSMFINKTVKQLKKDYPDKDCKNIIVEIVVSSKEFNIFIEWINEPELFDLTKTFNT